ncbi:UNVERIFIED_CONTAM: hypothetical protein FKN15_068520 [Acipenser sinensis]
MGELPVLFALNQTLLQHESLRAGSVQVPYTTEDLIKHYNCGDLSAIIFNHDTSQLPHFINSSLPDHERITAQQIDSYFRQELIYKRNERMGRRITELLEGNPGQAFFFAFGAGFVLHVRPYSGPTAVGYVTDYCNSVYFRLPHFINSSLPDHERITAQQIDSYFRQELIYKRNERMGRRITELLEGNPGQAFFFAFGAGRERNHHGYNTGALFKSGECPS